MATVEFEHVDKIYPGGTRAVADCTLRIDDGELVVLVGPSGCGKSTLLRLLAGLSSHKLHVRRIRDDSGAVAHLQQQPGIDLQIAAVMPFPVKIDERDVLHVT